MIIMAEIMEKFLDGIFIGVIFTTKASSAFATFLAVWLHEFPVALAGIGILMDSGWKFPMALCIRIMLNCILFCGAGFGLALGALNKTVSMCTSLYVAGAFIYLALTLLMPEIKNEKNKCVQVLTMLGVLLGMGIMVFITNFE